MTSSRLGRAAGDRGRRCQPTGTDASTNPTKPTRRWDGSTARPCEHRLRRTCPRSMNSLPPGAAPEFHRSPVKTPRTPKFGRDYFHPTRPGAHEPAARDRTNARQRTVVGRARVFSPATALPHGPLVVRSIRISSLYGMIVSFAIFTNFFF